MARGHGRHRRPSARPATIVTLGAGALLLAAAMPAGSAVNPSSPDAVSQAAGVPAADGGLEELIPLVAVLLERLSSDPGENLDPLKDQLRQIRDETGKSQDELKDQLRQLRDSLSADERERPEVREVYDKIISILGGPNS